MTHKAIVRKTLKPDFYASSLVRINKNDNQALQIIRDNPGITILGEFTEH